MTTENKEQVVNAKGQENKSEVVIPDVLETKVERNIFKTPDGKEFLDKNEAIYYAEQLKSIVENYSLYLAYSNWVEKSNGEAGYAQENLILVDKEVNDKTNIFSISYVLSNALGVIPYVEVASGLHENFNLSLEVPRVDKLQDVESWSKVHTMAKKFLEADNERMEAELNANYVNDDSIAPYSTLVISLIEDQENNSSELALISIESSSFLRNSLRIIAGDKPYVSA